MECTFDLAWTGPCGVKDCEKHRNTLCACCSAPATRECDETFGGFVCGVHLCDDCVHELTPDGVNNSQMKHCRRSDQKHKPWYAQEVET